jgi:hypothetical protein
LSYGKVYKEWQKLTKCKIALPHKENVVIKSIYFKGFNSKIFIELRIKRELRHVFKEKENRFNIL